MASEVSVRYELNKVILETSSLTEKRRVVKLDLVFLLINSTKNKTNPDSIVSKFRRRP